jgi:hypothetical protein
VDTPVVGSIHGRCCAWFLLYVTFADVETVKFSTTRIKDSLWYMVAGVALALVLYMVKLGHVVIS